MTKVFRYHFARTWRPAEDIERLHVRIKVTIQEHRATIVFKRDACWNYDIYCDEESNNRFVRENVYSISLMIRNDDDVEALVKRLRQMMPNPCPFRYQEIRDSFVEGAGDQAVTKDYYAESSFLD